MTKKYIVIINPVAGGKRKISPSTEIETYLKELAIEFRTRYTTKQGDAHEWAKEAASGGYDIVIAAGGDGTINEVACALMYTKTALGIIPLGSGNGLARHLKIPIRIKGAIDYCVNASIKPIDTISINGHYSFNVSGFGFDALIAHRFQHAKTRGFWGYFNTVVKEIFNYKVTSIETLINKVHEQREIFICAIANSSQFGNMH